MESTETLNYADSLAAARYEMRAGKTGKAFPWYLLAVQLLKDAAEKEKAGTTMRRQDGQVGNQKQAANKVDVKGTKISSSVMAKDCLDSIEAEVVSMFITQSTTLLVK